MGYPRQLIRAARSNHDPVVFPFSYAAAEPAAVSIKDAVLLAAEKSSQEHP